MKTIYLLGRNGVYLDEETECLNFEIVLVGRGYFPLQTGIWMRWQKDDSNDRIFQKLDRRFSLGEKRIGFYQGLFFPERWLWEEEYENILIFIEPKELKAYAAALQAFSPESRIIDHVPEGFIYKFESQVRDNKLLVSGLGFLYGDEKEKCRTS